MAAALKEVSVRRDGATLVLKPVLRNTHGQIIYVAKNPRSWATNYSVWANVERTKALVSHHKTKVLATALAQRLQNTDVLQWLLTHSPRRSASK